MKFANGLQNGKACDVPLLSEIGPHNDWEYFKVSVQRCVEPRLHFKFPTARENLQEASTRLFCLSGVNEAGGAGDRKAGNPEQRLGPPWPI